MRVERITNPNINSGDNWSQSAVQLTNGQIVRVFNPVQVGDVLESYQKGKYTNWRVKPKDEKDDYIKLLESEVKELKEKVKKLESERFVNNSNVVVTSDVDMSDAPDFLQPEGK